jgi:branched-chain amino acid transport system permease protein
MTTEFFGIPLPALLGQLLLGLVNGSFYAMLSLGLAVIFGMLNIINFAHGALYMMGAFFAWMGLEYLGLNYWLMLGLAPLAVGLIGIVIERTMLQWLYKLDHLYGLLLTFGITLVIEGVFRSVYGVSGQPYQAAGRHQPRLHDPAQLPRLGRGRVAGGLLRRLGTDREDVARRQAARRH